MTHHRLLLVLALSLVPTAARAQERIPLGAGERRFLVPDVLAREGWSMAPDGAALRLELPPDRAGGAFGNLVAAVTAVELDALRGKRVRLRARVRVEGGRAQLWLRVDRAGGVMGFFDNCDDRPVRAGDGRTLEITGSVASDAQAVYLGLIATREQEGAAVRAWLSDAALEVVGEAEPAAPDRAAALERAAGAPGLVLARGSFAVLGGATHPRPVVRVPLPLCYREQVPLTWSLDVRPRQHLRAVELESDALGNRIAVLTLALGESDRAVVEWRSLILCAPQRWDDVPAAAPLPAAWPAEARPWLASTDCVQADDPRIVELARGITADTTDVPERVRRAIATAGRAASREGRAASLTAVDALDAQGSCTSNANLLAALLRAAGVPARVLSGYPVWSGPLQTHYTVEAFLPGHGWYPIESTLLRAPWPLHGQVQVAIVPPEHEGPRAGARPSAMGGVPYLSLTELDAAGVDLTTLDARHPGCDHVAVTHAVLQGEARDWARALELGRARWGAWLSSGAPADGTRLREAALAEVERVGGLVEVLERD